VPDGIRLQRVLADAGFGSRRACEVLIDQGRVSVNDEVIREQGRRVDPATDLIRVDGMRVTTDQHRVYLALNKPRGMLSTMADDRGRPCVGDLVRDRRDRLYHVGRLDADSEGLLLLTNDGELAHRLMHPSYGVPKTYLVELIGPLPREVGRELRRGVELDDGPASLDSFKVVSSAANRVSVEVVLHEGRNRVVRRMFDAVGHPVQRLVRTQIGSIALGSLRMGKLRHLTQHEIGKLYADVGL
jgi:23S rRNA pseudouridine2605 synthase